MYLDYASAPSVREVQSNGDVVDVRRRRVSVMVSNAHREEMAAGYFCDFYQFQTFQTVVAFTVSSGFVIYRVDNGNVR